MKKPKPHYLRLTSLKFISSVDVPAQETATARLFKRAGARIEVKGTARVAKVSDELGLVFGWAVTTKANHVDYIDLQGDNVVEEDLIKVAAEWMSAGGAADTMHDRQQDGQAVFCMPMTYEVAKAFYGDKIGGELGTYGLMVAIKPSAEDFVKFKSGELTGFSIDGMGERTPLEKAAGRAVKASLYTNEVDGHQHEVCICEDSLYVCYATSAGSENGHSHGIVFENGSLTILADSGHTHVLADGQAGVAIVPADAIVVVQASASPTKNAPTITPGSNGGASKSTPIAPVGKVASHPETKPMKLASILLPLLAMSVAEQSAIAKMAKDAPDSLEPFFDKPANEQAAIIKAATDADTVVFKGEVTGIEVRKSDGALALTLAKQNESTAATLAKREAEIEKADIRKLAAEVLAEMPGDNDVHDFIIAQLRKGDAVMAQKALETLKGMRAETKIGKRAPGLGGTDTPMAVTKKLAYVELEKGLAAFCVEKSIPADKMWLDGYDQFVKTAVGSTLDKAHREAKAA